jgi:hypothetical protein
MKTPICFNFSLWFDKPDYLTLEREENISSTRPIILFVLPCKVG